jgi:hypothetical protein
MLRRFLDQSTAWMSRRTAQAGTGRAHHPHRRHPQLEPLEGRRLLSFQGY